MPGYEEDPSIDTILNREKARPLAPPPLHKPYGGYITTRTGKRFMIAEPTLDMVCIEDIAHALSMICHFGGHTKEFFSVAQHSVLVSHIAKALGYPHVFRRYALLHDASEAYIGDLVRPLKALLPEYKLIEERIMQVILQKFEVAIPVSELAVFKTIDDSALKLEAQVHMTNAVLHDGHGNAYDIADAPPINPLFIIACGPFEARDMFLREYSILFEDDDGL